MTKVVHCKVERYEIYIGRPSSPSLCHFGNPFSHLEKSKAQIRVETRQDAIVAFDKWLAGTDHQQIEPDRRRWILNNMESLRGKILGCWCKPQACHGDVLVEMLMNRARS